MVSNRIQRRKMIFTWPRHMQLCFSYWNTDVWLQAAIALTGWDTSSSIEISNHVIEINRLIVSKIVYATGSKIDTSFALKRQNIAGQHDLRSIWHRNQSLFSTRWSKYAQEWCWRIVRVLTKRYYLLEMHHSNSTFVDWVNDYIAKPPLILRT